MVVREADFEDGRWIIRLGIMSNGEL